MCCNDHLTFFKMYVTAARSNTRPFTTITDDLGVSDAGIFTLQRLVFIIERLRPIDNFLQKDGKTIDIPFLGATGRHPTCTKTLVLSTEISSGTRWGLLIPLRLGGMPSGQTMPLWSAIDCPPDRCYCVSYRGKPTQTCGRSASPAAEKYRWYHRKMIDEWYHNATNHTRGFVVAFLAVVEFLIDLCQLYYQ